MHVEALTARWRKTYATGTVHLRTGYLKKLLRAIGAATNRQELATFAPRTRDTYARRPLAQAGELERLLAVMPPWLRCALTIASHTAMRRSDVLRLAPTHYDPQTNTLNLIQKKSSEPLHIPASPELQAEFANASPSDNPNTPLVERYAGKPVSSGMLTAAWGKARKRAGVNPNLTPHSFRHTTATALYLASHDLRLVQQLLGHRSMTSTIRYLEHDAPNELRAAMQQLWTPKGPIQ